MSTTQEIKSYLTKKEQALPWYLKDLPNYLKGFALITVVFVGLRIYQGVFGVAIGVKFNRL